MKKPPDLERSLADLTQAIGMLAQCYIHDNNELYARATIGYLSERYSRELVESRA